MNDDDAEHAYLLTLHIALLHLELRDVFDAFCRFVDEQEALDSLLLSSAASTVRS